MSKPANAPNAPTEPRSIIPNPQVNPQLGAAAVGTFLRRAPSLPCDLTMYVGVGHAVAE